MTDTNLDMGIFGGQPTGEFETDPVLDDVEQVVTQKKSGEEEVDLYSEKEIVSEADEIFDRVLESQRVDPETENKSELDRLRQQVSNLQNTLLQVTTSMNEVLVSKTPNPETKKEEGGSRFNYRDPAVIEYLRENSDNPEKMAMFLEAVVEDKVKVFEEKIEKLSTPPQEDENTTRLKIYEAGLFQAWNEGDELEKKVIIDVKDRGQNSELSRFLRDPSNASMTLSPGGISAAVTKVASGIRKAYGGKREETQQNEVVSGVRSSTSASRGGNRGRELYQKSNTKTKQLTPQEEIIAEIAGLEDPNKKIAFLDPALFGGK